MLDKGHNHQPLSRTDLSYFFQKPLSVVARLARQNAGPALASNTLKVPDQGADKPLKEIRDKLREFNKKVERVEAVFDMHMIPFSQTRVTYPLLSESF
eukprot:jgi/Botrbrau1/8351/Bobra.0046s0013.1